MSRITAITGRAIILSEENIDTDRIIPARFLKCVVFDNLGEHVFEDDKKAMHVKGQTHPFDDPRFKGAAILFVGRNFGSGSSREHAVAGLKRWGMDEGSPGIGLIVSYGEFSDIFFVNALSNGIPCVIVSKDDFEEFVKKISEDPCTEMLFSLERMTLSTGTFTVSCRFQRTNAHTAFLEGSWDTLHLLLKAGKKIEKTMENLPYLSTVSW